MLISQFDHSLAIVIGINQYDNGITRLHTAANDASALAQLLKSDHGYDVRLLIDYAATKQSLLSLLNETLPQTVTPNDRVLFYPFLR